MSPTSSTSTILIISALDLLMAALAAALGLLVIFSAAGASNAGAGTQGLASFASWTQLEFEFDGSSSIVACTHTSASRGPIELVPIASGAFTAFRIDDSVEWIVSCTAHAVVDTNVHAYTPSGDVFEQSECQGELVVTLSKKTDATPTLALECMHG